MELLFENLLCIAIIVIIIYTIQNYRYKKTAYYHQTHISYLSVVFNKGRLGEYYTYKYLKKLEGYQRYLFNVYLPKDDGETTELDVVLLHESGIYVFESKNYSGWIFGTEFQPYWTQTLPTGRGRSQKNSFYNPVLQNKGHLKWLQAFLNDQSLSFYSFIVFSDRCTLKKVSTSSENLYVLNRYNLLSKVRQVAAETGNHLSTDKIDELFATLYPLTQKSEAEKQIHINQVKQKSAQHSTKSVSHTVDRESSGEKICPRCGGVLVMRTASRGASKGRQFLGCSNYPKCRYIKKI